MDSIFQRTELLLGAENMKKLSRAHVAVFGVGGVGSYAAEALARSGVGNLTVIDADVVDVTNINRQLIATTKTVGVPKVEAAAQRLKEINPNLKVQTVQLFYGKETQDTIDMSVFDYIIDAIDSVSSKLLLAETAHKCRTPIISCMGAGNKLDPTQFEVADIAKTSVCPLARVMRQELRKRGIHHLKVVYSKEPPLKPAADQSLLKQTGKRQVPGSIAFVPSCAGLILAGEVIKDLIL